MKFGQIDTVREKMTQAEKDLVIYIEKLRSEMNTPYRKKCIELAAWGVNEYEGVSRDKVSNVDLMNIQLSYPIVNQRLSDLFNNPSRADYRTVDEEKEQYIDILRRVSEYDKQVGRFNSEYQELERIANIEGSAFFAEEWHEELDEEGNTIGIPHTKLRSIRMNDFFWDKAAKNIEDMNHGMERQVYSYENFIKTFLPMEKDGWKNIRAVRPMQKDSKDSVYDEKWEKAGRDQQGNTVTVWIFESKAFLEAGKIKNKHVVIANGILIYESDKLPMPCINRRKLLSWSKIDGLPSGHMIGYSIPIIIRHPQEAFSRLLTISIAAAELAGSPPLLTRAGADSDFDDYPVFPGSIIPVRGSGKSISEDYQFLQSPDISQGAQKMMADIIEYVIMLTGIDIRALFVGASEKAITTENKRQIQQKLLRFSVQWNEEHGFYDMELKRLALIQKYYPLRRTYIEEDFDGNTYLRKDYPMIPVKDYEIQQDTKNKIKLNFKKGAYSPLKITPDVLRFNVDLVLEGATSINERDIIEQRNFIENFQIIMSVPAFAQKIQENPDKSFKLMLERMNLDEDAIIEDVNVKYNKMHPAMKEISAIELNQVLSEQGIKLPDFFSEVLPEDYDPTEYVEIFSNYMRSDRYKKLNAKQKRLFSDRDTFHNENSINPYFDEMRIKQKEAEKQKQMAAMQGAAPGGAAQIPSPERSPEDMPLTESVRAQAGELAAAARGE